MIIRRFVTAVRQQDWGLAVLDFLIVVAGIFVGLQVDALVQERKDARTGYETLARIYGELESQKSELNLAIKNAIAEDPQKAGENVKLTYEALAYSTYVSAYNLRTVVFETAMSQGIFDFIANQETRDKITKHYEEVVYWEKVIEVISRYRDQFDEALAGIGGMKWARTASNPEDLALVTPDDAIEIGRALRDSAEIQKWLPRQWTYHDAMKSQAEARLHSVLELQQSIAEELQRGPVEFHSHLRAN